MWTKGNLVDLSGVFVQSRDLDTQTIQIINDDLTVGSGTCDIITVCTIRPLDVVYFQIVSMSCRIYAVMSNHLLAYICFLGTRSAIDAYSLQDFSTCKNGECFVMVDIKGSDFGADLCPQAGILGRERIEPALSQRQCAFPVTGAVGGNAS
jgi:hypothetical protein